MLRETCIAKAL